jgi:hypothetical protein
MMRLSRTLFMALAVGSLAATAGCASFSFPLGSAPLAKCTDPAAVANGTQAMAIVELRPDGRDPKVYQMPLDSDMHVQDAIEKSRAKRKFRRMNVSVLRTSPEGRRHKMDCRYESGKKRIAVQYDYALQSGDYIIITEDTSTIVDDMFAEISAPVKVFNAHSH